MSYSDSDSTYYDSEEEEVCVCNNPYECQCVELIINKKRIRIDPNSSKTNP